MKCAVDEYIGSVSEVIGADFFTDPNRINANLFENISPI